MTTHIGSLADLRPGDLLFGPIGGVVPGLFPVGVGQLVLGEVFRAGPFSVRHVGIVVQDWTHNLPGPVGPRLVQAMPSGAEEITLLEETHWTPRYAYARLPEDYPGQAKDAAAIARLFVSEKVPYSFASYAALAAWRFGLKAERLAGWINRRGRRVITESPVDGRLMERQLPAEAICSVLADQAWTLAGAKVVTGTRPQIVTPGMLATQLWRRDDVIWGRPA